MVNTIYLHIGTGKSGSTTIQEFLFKNRDILLDKGYFFPLSPGAPHHIRIPAYATVGSRIHSILNRLDIYKEEEAEAFEREFQEQFKAELSSCSADNLILSSEFCFSLRQNEIDKIKRLLEGVANKVLVVVYLRKQEDFWLSRYAQTVKTGSSTEMFKMPEQDDIERLLDYYPILQRWEKSFGIDNIIVRPFERTQMARSNPAWDFLSVLGLEFSPEYTEPVFMNKRIDTKTLEMVRRINKALDTQKEPRTKADRQRLGEAAQDISEGSGFKLSAQDKNELLARVGPGNAEIARRYLGRSDGVLFYEDDVSEFETMQDLDVESAIDVAARLWLWSNNRILALENRLNKLKQSLADDRPEKTLLERIFRR